MLPCIINNYLLTKVTVICERISVGLNDEHCGRDAKRLVAGVYDVDP